MIVRVFKIEGYLGSMMVEEEFHHFSFAFLSLEGTFSWTGQVGPELYQDRKFRKIITTKEDASDRDLYEALDEGYTKQVFLFTLDPEQKKLVWKKKFARGKLKKRLAEIKIEKKEYNQVLSSFFKFPFCSPEKMTELKPRIPIEGQE